MRQFTSREFNQDVSAAKRAADTGPVVITDRGKEAYVLLSYGAYRDLTNRSLTIVDLLAQDGEDFVFDPPKLGDLFRATDDALFAGRDEPKP